jgi:hypothetical protein
MNLAQHRRNLHLVVEGRKPSGGGEDGQPLAHKIYAHGSSKVEPAWTLICRALE